MPHLRASIVFSAGLLLLGTATLGAQEIPSPYRFIEKGQEAGVIFGQMDLDPGRFGFGPKSSSFYGGRYAVAVGGPVSLEGVLLFIPTERDVVNPRRVDDQVLEDPSEVTLVNMSARLRFNLTGRRTWNGIQPFALAGAGVMFDAQGRQAEDQRLEEDERFEFGTSFAGVFGGGLRWIVQQRIAVTGEAAINLYQLDVPEGWRDPQLGLEGSPESEWVSAGTFTLGVSLLF
jgi:hypothetical protein